MLEGMRGRSPSRPSQPRGPCWRWWLTRLRVCEGVVRIRWVLEASKLGKVQMERACVPALTAEGPRVLRT